MRWTHFFLLLVVVILAGLGVWLLQNEPGSSEGQGLQIVSERPDAKSPGTKDDELADPVAIDGIQVGERKAASESTPGDRGIGRVVDVFERPIAGAAVVFITPRKKVSLGKSGLDGEFTFPTALNGVLSATKESHAVLHEPAWPVAAGAGHSDAEIVLSRLASLTVQVLDGDGQPAGKRIAVRRDPSEYLGPRDDALEWSTGFQLYGVSGEDGRQRFEILHSQQRLFVTLPGQPTMLGEYPETVYSHVDANGALLARDAMASGAVQGTPLWLQPGEHRVVRLVLPTHTLRKVSGQILRPDGKPGVGINVAWYDLSQGPEVEAQLIGSVMSNDKGNFEFEEKVGSSSDSFLFAVVREMPYFRSFGRMGRPKPQQGSRHKAWAVLTGSQLAGHIALQLQPMQTISGRVEDVQGNPISVPMLVKPIGHEWWKRYLGPGTGSQTYSSESGEFEIIGLFPGRHDVGTESPELGQAWVRGLQAGATDVKVQMRGEGKAVVNLRVSSDLPGKSFQLLYGRLMPYRGMEPPGVPVLTDGLRVQGPFGWPEDAPNLVSEGSMQDGPLGISQYVAFASNSGKREYRILPGLYSFGAKATFRNGGESFPAGTGLLRVPEGEFEISIDLAPAGALRGKVRGLPAAHDVSLAIATADGELLLFPTSRRGSVRTLGIPSAGGFYLPTLPAQDLELRLGHRAELLTGNAQRRFPVNIPAGEEFTWDIEW